MTSELTATIEELTRNEYGIFAAMACGKHRAYICIKDWEFRVIVQNASHRVWKGGGRSFKSASDAIAYYKQDAVKAMIAAADKLNS